MNNEPDAELYPGYFFGNTLNPEPDAAGHILNNTLNTESYAE